MFGSQYRSAWAPVSVLAGGQVLVACTGLSGFSLTYGGHPQVVAALSTIVVVTFVPSALVLGKAYGPVGVAAPAAALIGAQSILQAWFAKDRLGVNTLPAFRANTSYEGLDRVKLAVFDDRYPLVYGAQQNMLLLAEACGRSGHDVSFVTTRQGALADEATAPRGLDVVICPAPPEMLRFERALLLGGPVQVLRTAAALVRFSARLHRALRKLGVEVVMASAVRSATMLSVTGLLRRPRVVLYAQNSTPLGLFAAITALFSWRICLIADGAATTFPRSVLRVVRHKLRALPSGRQLDGQTAARRSISDTPRRVLTVASITRRKGLDLVIEAVATARDAVGDLELVIVGGTTGPKSESYLEELRQQAQTRSLDVSFTGWAHDVLPYYEQAIFRPRLLRRGPTGRATELSRLGFPV